MKVFFGFIIAFLVVAYASHFYNVASMDVHYRLTVTLDTPEGEVSGSSIRALYSSSNRVSLPSWMEEGDPTIVRGEAVAINLPNTRTIFALISDQSRHELLSAFPQDSDLKTVEDIKFYKSLPIGSKADLAKQHWPEIVTFSDPSDVNNIESVFVVKRCQEDDASSDKCQDIQNSYTIVNNVKDYLGQGVSIKNVTVEITDEPVTWGQIDPYITKGDEKYFGIGDYEFKRVRFPI